MHRDRLFNQLQKLARAGRFTYSFEEDSFEISEDLNRLLGRSSRTEIMSLEVFLQDHVFPEDQDLLRETLLESRHRALFQPRPFRILLSSGLVFWFKAWGEPLSEQADAQIDGFFMDITAEKELEASLRLQQGNLRNIFESSPIPLALVTADVSRYLMVNHLFLEVLGLNDHSLNGEKPLDWLADPAQKEDLLLRLSHHGQVRGQELLVRDALDRETWVLASATLTSFYDRQAYLIGFADISLQKSTEAELREANLSLEKTQQELKAAKEAAESSNIVKSEFIANMSHEFRTPLNIVIGFSEILATSPLDPRQKSHVDSILSGAKNLLLLINDILDLSKIEAGSLSLTREFIDLPVVVRDVLSIFSLKVQEKGLYLELEVNSHPDLLFELDEIRLRQILFNIVGNAVKFTSKGSIKVTIFAQPLEADAYSLELAVKDTGIGITPEAQSTIFESFRQQDPSISRTYGGTGLGLAITRRLTNLLGGQISLESQPGQGSTFRIVFPSLLTQKKKRGAEERRGQGSRLAEGQDAVPSLLRRAEDKTPTAALDSNSPWEDLVNKIQTVKKSRNFTEIQTFVKSLKGWESAHPDLSPWIQDLTKSAKEFDFNGLQKNFDGLENYLSRKGSHEPG